MVIQIFLINLKTALQHKHPYFKTLYNKEVLQLIDELIKLKVISYVRYAENERRIEPQQQQQKNRPLRPR